MDILIGLGIIFLGLFVVLFVGALIFQLLCYSMLFRLVFGGALIWIIWSNVTTSSEPFAWLGTIFIGLAILSPWIIVVIIGGIIVGYLVIRR